LLLFKKSVVVGLFCVSQLMGTGGSSGADLPCSVCAGVRIADPAVAVDALANEPKLGDDDAFFLAWTMPLDGTADVDFIDRVRRTGAKPWLRVVFRTPQPIADNLDRLEVELEELAALVRGGGEGLFVQAVWLPAAGATDFRDHAFLIKRAAVAVTGASPSANFIVGPLEADPESLRALYREEIAAYVDLIALAPADDLTTAVATLGELDPGKPVVLDALPIPGKSEKTVARVAGFAAAGFAVTFFEADSVTAADLAPLKWMARELRGNLVFDPYSNPSGAHSAWAFVREDLGLRLIAEPEPATGDLELVFADAQFRTPVAVDLATGVERFLYDTSRDAGGLTIRLHEPDDVVLLRLERPSAEELDAFDQQIDVGADREIPVEEILRRLQAFEDAQERRLDHFQATRSLHLRFQAAQGAFEASYIGDFFFRHDHGFDWVWKDFYVGGVKWKSKKIPSVPLIQPEKVASLPAEIRLTKDYDYRLRGAEIVDGRDCWVIDFRPLKAAPGRSLYRGTVWVDREIHARVRTRATQVGLEGSVLAAEETRFYVPFDNNGLQSEWTAESFVLPVRISGQQTFSILSATLPVEVETEITDVRINGEGFERNRAAALASDATMLRDTDDGLRYLKKDETGERFVETEFDSDRLFLVGGVFWDESVDFPLPLAGVNYLDLDFKGTGAQIDVFFAGAFLAAGIADPQLFGSRWNGGVNLNGLFFKARDELFRDGVVVPEEDVKRRTASADVFVGRPLARFLNFELTYGLRMEDFSRADDTAEEFIIPQDTLTNYFRGVVQYNRAGYRLRLSGGMNRRSDWQFWGLPGNEEYDPDQKDFFGWQARFGKTWWLPKFRRVRVFFEHLDGSNLDRFSGYDFGMFGDASVSGYQGGLVRAEKANGAHLLAGINYFEKIRFDLKADVVWASNAMTGLDNELLAGIGLEGTMTLPWQLIMNFEAGYAVAGPGKGNIALRVFFLKLFPGS
jgi:hypothetical protein